MYNAIGTRLVTAIQLELAMIIAPLGHHRYYRAINKAS